MQFWPSGMPVVQVQTVVVAISEIVDVYIISIFSITVLSWAATTYHSDECSLSNSGGGDQRMTKTAACRRNRGRPEAQSTLPNHPTSPPGLGEWVQGMR